MSHLFEITRKSAEATKIMVCLLAAGTKTIIDLPTIASGDVKVIRHTGGSWSSANITYTPVCITAGTRNVYVQLTATELTQDDPVYPVIINFVDQTSPKEWEDMSIMVWTTPIPADITKINGELTSGNNATLYLKKIDITDPIPADITKINGELTSGNNATLYLKKLDITNSAGDAVLIQSTGSNGYGLKCYSHGTGHGVAITGGTTGRGLHIAGGSSYGEAMYLTANNDDTLSVTASGTSGRGVYLAGSGSGEALYIQGGTSGGLGIYASGGAGATAVYIQGVGSGTGLLIGGGATGKGLQINGGSTSGDAVNLSTTNGKGIGITATGNNPALELIGAGTGSGAEVKGGANGRGLLIVGGSTSGNSIELLTYSGKGLYVESSGSNDAIYVRAAGSGSGVNINAGDTGHGIRVAGGYTSGFGVDIFGQGSAIDLNYGLRIRGGTNSHAVYCAGGTNFGSGMYLFSQSTANQSSGLSLYSTYGSALHAENLLNGHGATIIGHGSPGSGLYILSQHASNPTILLSNSAGGSIYNTQAKDEITDYIWNESQSGHTTAGTFGKYLDTQISSIGSIVPTASQIADAVWDESRSGHTTAGTFGLYLDTQISSISSVIPTAATIADAVWDETLSLHVSSGTTGANLNSISVATTGNISELTVGIPPVNPSIKEALMLSYMALRNKQTTTSSDTAIYNNAGTRIAHSYLTDDGTTYTKDKMASGA